MVPAIYAGWHLIFLLNYKLFTALGCIGHFIFTPYTFRPLKLKFALVYRPCSSTVLSKVQNITSVILINLKSAHLIKFSDVFSPHLTEWATSFDRLTYTEWWKNRGERGNLSHWLYLQQLHVQLTVLKSFNWEQLSYFSTIKVKKTKLNYTIHVIKLR